MRMARLRCGRVSCLAFSYKNDAITTGPLGLWMSVKVRIAEQCFGTLSNGISLLFRMYPLFQWANSNR